jgi:hypothetical protein
MNEKKPIIKNATAEDIEALKGNNIVEAIPASKQNQEVINSSLKPKLSQFEPDPVQFLLPSGGHFVSDGYIYIRRLSTAEEGILLKLSNEKDFNFAINKIFESAIKSDISISNIPLIDKIPIFITIIGLTYGGNLSISDLVKEDCKSCRDNEKVYINILQDINIKQLEESFVYPLSITSDDGNYIIKYRYPTIKDEGGSEDGPLDFIRKIIIEIKDAKTNTLIDKKNIEEIIQWLTSSEKKKISTSLAEISKYGGSFDCKINNCSNKSCSMKGQSITMTSENILTRVINSIIENLAI